MIAEMDKPLLDAFLIREVADYVWRKDGTELIRQSLWVALKRQILEAESNEAGVTGIVVSSMANLGYAIRSLYLSTSWVPGGHILYCHLGTTPRDPVKSQNVPFSGIEDMTSHLGENK